MLFKLSKKKAINSYLTSLPKLMTKDYGKSLEYSPMQVIKSIERYKLNAKYQIYAVALYTEQEDFIQYCESNQLTFDYKLIRDELSRMYFDGFDFSSTDVAKYSVSFSGFKYVDPSGDEGDLMCVDGDGD